jgi:hypothetical protein
MAVRRKKRGGARPGSGRRLSASEERRTHSVTIRLTDSEYATASVAAGTLPLSQFARTVLLRALTSPKATNN